MDANISIGSSGQSSDETDGAVDRDRLRDARLPRRETQRTDSGRDRRIDACRAFYCISLGKYTWLYRVLVSLSGCQKLVGDHGGTVARSLYAGHVFPARKFRGKTNLETFPSFAQRSAFNRIDDVAGSFGRRVCQFELGRLDLVRHSGSHIQWKDSFPHQASIHRRMSGIAQESGYEFYAGRRNRDQVRK